MSLQLLNTALIYPDGTIRNARGQVVCQDNIDEKLLLNSMQERILNTTGMEVDITTLTEIKRSVVKQKFYEIAIADYVPVVVGEGAFASNLLLYREFSTGEDFESGNINMAANNARLAETDVAVDSLDIKIINWAKVLGYTIFELEQASRAGNWSLIEAKERSRYKNWVLGLQKIAFTGSAINPDVLGLLTQTGVTSNLTLITEPISDMDTTAFAAFVAGALSAYQSNCNFTAYPSKFIIPATDYNGLAAPVSEAFPINSKLEFLENAFKTITNNPNFKILPLAYAQQDKNDNTNRYTLTTDDQDSIQMNIPVDYTTTIQDTTNGFQWQSAAYGQYSGVLLGRPLETLYFDYDTLTT